MKRIVLWISMLLIPFAAHGQTAVLPVYACGNPGIKAVTSGSSSSNYLEGVIPSCLVKVYLTNTTTPATIYKDSSNTPQANPFTANTNGSIPPIYAATGQGYDVVLSGGITPNTYTIPITLTDLSVGIGSGGFPITLGSTSIAGSSTTTSVSGLTVDGVTPTVMGYVDPTSSIQTQLNGKQATLGFTPYNATNPSGYISGNQTITLGGILSGSGATSITASAGSGYYMPSTTDESNWNGKQAAINGTGFVKSSGTTISYDNSTYLTTSAAASTYQLLLGFTPYNATNPAGYISSAITSVNALTGPALTLACGTGLSCISSGSTITVSLATAFTINSFTGGSTVELGYPVVNPTFAATYSVTPASASITNTDNISSPTNLTTPFTTATIVGTFQHPSTSTTTFTLTATQGATLTATQTINWQPAIFGGVGTAGATSSVSAAGTTAVLSNGNVLARMQLGAETVGETFGPFNPSGQVIYLLLTGGSHTFIDAGTGFPFAFNAPITVPFLNANGVSITLYLYQSTNALFGTYTPKVAS